MIKRDWKLPKSIFFHIHKHCTPSFTSKQPIFTSQQALFTVLNAPNLKREKRLQNGTKWLNLPPQAPPYFNGVSQWLKTSYTPFYKHTSPFLQANRHFSQFLMQQIQAAKISGKNSCKMVQKWEKWVAPQWGSPMGGPNGSYLPVYPILQAKNSFYNQFLLNFYDAPPQRRDASVFRPQGCSGRGCQHLTHPPMCSLHLCGHFDTKFTIIRQF